MARTNADYQRAHRERRAERIVALEVTVTALRDRAESAEAALAVANDEIERLSGLACKHPSAAVSGGRCQACGADVW